MQSYRYYIQPQWVFDCINARRILPVSDYFPDTILPPHLSPFVDETETGEYVPPEKQRLLEGKSLVVPRGIIYYIRFYKIQNVSILFEI